MILFRFLILILFFGFVSCGPISERKQPPPSLNQLASTDLKLNGEQLANAYCATCHLKPDPDILDQKTWGEKVLPDMRKRLGLFLDEDFGTTMPVDMDIPKGIYSDFPLIKKKDWDKIVEYYLENSPLLPNPQKEKKAIKLGIPGFELIKPTFSEMYPDLVTMLRIHPNTGDLWLGHRYKSLFILNSKAGFQIKDSIGTETAPIDIRWGNTTNDFELLTMGLMDPSNDSLGSVHQFKESENKWNSTSNIGVLKRPVDIEYADFNNDGVLDKVISEFGNHIGDLSLYLSANQNWNKIILKNAPGARKVVIEDLDSDGDLDILALMTQANEGFFAFLNQGDGVFEEKTVLRFQPAFGSSDFSFEDMDGDGLKDLVLVNGDNADLSQILKDFHGVRIFRNQGDLEFEQFWFYPMYGSSGLEIEDFDQDGDKDLFVLSFFPDVEQKPTQSLLYFEQTNILEFDPYSPFNTNTESHWLIMTKGDLDLDGDMDVVI
ncbi:VCBS repeat-containing protein [Algoriphagus sp.]|uniref:FG-GAP repeat domain-containing protein n=1 Tax=Algoriphagus sp. TaxID=1872435 RepID=UPI0025FD2FDC|nr:VCBS repeat-containing protein [Algoriphagus sp.]